MSEISMESIFPRKLSFNISIELCVFHSGIESNILIV